MEAKLLPKEREVWEGLKSAIYEVENGTATRTSLDDFLNELEHENTLAPCMTNQKWKMSMMHF